jgi:HSP20 family protein
MTDLVPSSFFRFPAIRSIWDDEDDWLTMPSTPSGLSISEDDKNVYIEAALPGIDPKNIEVTFNKGIVWIKGETASEEKDGKKYYRKATSSFSYRVAVPGEIDQNSEPAATYKNGVMKVIFAKLPQSQPKKIAVKAE